MPWVRTELREQGVTVSRKRVARLMRKEDLQGVSRRRTYILTTRRDERQRPAPGSGEASVPVGFSQLGQVVY